MILFAMGVTICSNTVSVVVICYRCQTAKVMSQLMGLQSDNYIIIT